MPQLSLRTSLVDTITITEEDGAIIAIDWGWGRDQHETPLLLETLNQLEQYFDGERQAFDLPLNPHGTPYQRRVWDALLAIPYGETRTYGEIAAIAGGVSRSVGGANSRNPIPIIIPCHRVLAATGLGGFSGGEGPETKRRLLHLENRATESPARLF